jgi:DNA-binding transcriptional MerR regulator
MLVEVNVDVNCLSRYIAFPMADTYSGPTAGVVCEPRYRIGEIAEQIGVSTRTLRYYEEIGLLAPSSYSKGGSRRYDEADIERIQRIRELQAVMGFNLDDIREILQADDRIAELRTEYRTGVTPKRQRAILSEATRLNARTQAQVRAKIARLEAFRADLDAQSARCRQVAFDLGIDSLSEPAADSVGRSGC